MNVYNMEYADINHKLHKLKQGLFGWRFGLVVTRWQTGECVYRIPCHNCDCRPIYIGETGRNYGKRQEEHRKEVESISNRSSHDQAERAGQQK